MEALRQASFFALLTLTIDFVPLVVAILYVVRPTEHRLALMRPVSLAGIFSALSGTVVGVLNLLRGMTVAGGPLVASRATEYVNGLFEALIPVFVGFACLTVAWLLVAVGMSRSAEAA